MKDIKARPVCSIYACGAETTDTAELLPSGTGHKVRCEAGHVTNGAPPKELRNRMDVCWVRI